MAARSGNSSNTAWPEQMAGSTQEMIKRMQKLLTERIEQAHKNLRSSEEAFSQVQDNRARILQLERELDALRTAFTDVSKRNQQLELENSLYKSQIVALQKDHQASEVKIKQLRSALQSLEAAAAREVGLCVKTLLPLAAGGLLKRKPALTERAALLTRSGIVHSEWYLARYPDVKAAGMEAGVHYVLHGAGEGRVANPVLEAAAQE